MPDQRFVKAYENVRLEPESRARIRAALERELSSGEEKVPVKTFNRSIRLFILAAVVALLMAGSAYAISGVAHSTGSHYMHGQGEYTSLRDLKKVEKIVGYPVTLVEEFENGYRFERLNIGGEAAYDENFSVLKEYYGVMAAYAKPGAGELTIALTPVLDLPTAHAPRSPSETRDVDGVTVALNFDHYKFVPEDYGKTPADLAREQAGHYFISFGSDSIQEYDYAFANFVLDGVDYVIMSNRASPDSADTLTAMAAELIAAHADK